MNLSYTDRITILSALSQKAETINSWLKEDPNDEFWNDKLANVKAAYKNFSDREMEIGEQTNGCANTYRPNDLGY